MPVKRIVIGDSQAGDTEAAEIAALSEKTCRCERLHIRFTELVFGSTPQDPWGLTK